MSGRPWGVYRRPDGTLEVAFVHFHDGVPLERFPTRPEAVAAREALERAEELKALREAGQRELFA